MKKKIIMSLLSAVLLSNSVYATDLSDWALADYENMSKSGVLTYEVVSNKLNDIITRREVCTMLVSLYRQIVVSDIEMLPNPFTDTDDESVIKAYSVGIVSGKSENTFDPEGGVTRQEFAKMVLNLLSVSNIEFEVDDDVLEEILEKYDDKRDIAQWAEKAMAVSVRTGIISGTTETTLSPEGNATREQAICMVNRIHDKFVRNPGKFEVPYLVSYEMGDFGDIDFTWNTIPEAKKYIIIIKDSQAEVMDAVETTVAKTSVFSEAYLTGTYTIVIGAESSNGVQTYSVPKDFNFVEPVYEEVVYTSESLSEKEARVFPGGKAFRSAAEAKIYMVSVTVPVWKLNSKGEKYSSEMTITVNQALASDVINIFTEIYNSPEKFPMKDVGGYYWRNTAGGKLSQHSYGTCIDINANENYYVKPNGTPIVGSFWKPYENPYSIPEDGIVVQTFAKYGWEWGGNCWGPSYSKDYMHFTYLGK